eukprot:TRINITY_DN4986_c0_g2_i9.p1 TRINITY_DN4986_c0_g2~~TRINITY_DN4986_c0_g2_i9.p1  ORF type:complete len:214 (+),score=40.68 TRINITY_DN4986_c0_g2_i9:389-1030(+)
MQVYPRYGDIRGAWAARSSRGTEEFLEFVFPVEVHITGIDIFETYNPGHVVKVSALYDTEWVELYWEPWKDKHLVTDSRVFSPPLHGPYTHFKSKTVRLDLDCRQARSWAEIDCVVLRGLTAIEWKQEDHHLYPPSFRAMVRTLLLINEKHDGYWLPHAIILEIVRFAARDWPSESEIQRRLQQEALTQTAPTHENGFVDEITSFFNKVVGLH